MSETRTAASDARADAYDRMLRLADVFDAAAEEMRVRSRLGAEVLRDPALADSAPLAPSTHAQVEADLLGATSGRHGLLTRSVELDADALVVRATVLTYRWIDELQTLAHATLGSLAGRAVGYLAPGVALGGAIVSAGLIETDALDRDGVAAYLGELAAHNPELMEHVSTGGGGLLDGLQMRALLTVGGLTGETGRRAARGGLRAIGVAPLTLDAGSALRDIAGALTDPDLADPDPADPPTEELVPRTLLDLMVALAASRRSVAVQRVAPGRFIAYLPGPGGGDGRRLRLVGADTSSYAALAVRTIERAVADEPGARVMLVGSAAGGVTAAEVAAAGGSAAFVIDQVVTAGAPGSHVPRIPEHTRVLSLEDRADPVALLGTLVDASSSHRTTVVVDGDSSDGESLYVAAARAVDATTEPTLVAEISRIRELGFLAG